MRKIFLCLLSVITLFSFYACKDKNQYSRTLNEERVKDSILQKELSEIDMNEVDSYPLFDKCTELASKEAQKACFERMLSQLFADTFSDEKFSVTESVNDTIIVVGKVTNVGKIIFDKTICKSKTRELLPNLDSLLEVKMNSFTKVKPASKRGVHVNLQFQMPLIINVN